MKRDHISILRSVWLLRSIIVVVVCNMCARSLLWVSCPVPVVLIGQAEGDVQLELSEDGILSVVSGDKKVWSSTLTPLGKRLPDFR